MKIVFVGLLFLLFSPLSNSVCPNNQGHFLFLFMLSRGVCCHVKIYIHCPHLIFLVILLTQFLFFVA